uniref:Uncharacterized protein n=1 Tax=Rhizochromulina marina TaxID=1034831 RepID=A0A7S2W868_9STRA
MGGTASQPETFTLPGCVDVPSMDVHVVRGKRELRRYLDRCPALGRKLRESALLRTVCAEDLPEPGPRTWNTSDRATMVDRRILYRFADGPAGVAVAVCQERSGTSSPPEIFAACKVETSPGSSTAALSFLPLTSSPGLSGNEERFFRGALQHLSQLGKRRLRADASPLEWATYERVGFRKQKTQEWSRCKRQRLARRLARWDGVGYLVVLIELLRRGRAMEPDGGPHSHRGSDDIDRAPTEAGLSKTPWPLPPPPATEQVCRSPSGGSSSRNKDISTLRRLILEVSRVDPDHFLHALLRRVLGFL